MDIKQLYRLYQEHPCITTDSRDCPKDSIFFALKGANFNGNAFAEKALAAGCAYAVIDEKAYRKDDRYILVDDVLQTFKDLAREHRRQFDINVLAITGTNGKTTTKELTAAVLREQFNVLATEGNFNNDVGVPKTLFRLNKSHEVAIIEMGASHPGDIKTLAETAEPDCGLITNIGKAHLQGFGSFEGVKKTKGELYDFLEKQKDGTVFLNADDDTLFNMLPDEVQVIAYSKYVENSEYGIIGEVISASPFLKFRWRDADVNLKQQHQKVVWYTVETRLIGQYNIDNLMAAVTVGLAFGVPPEKINHALSSYQPGNSRSQLVETEKHHLIVDAYNANPSSMRAAIKNFCEMDVPDRMLILGDMRELGKDSEKYHQEIVDLLDRPDIGKVWLVGDEFAKTRCRFRKFKDVGEVKKAFTENEPLYDYILIKGSNGTRLYELAEALQA